MDAVMNVINAIRGMGATVMTPIFLFIIALCVRVPFGKSLKAAINVAIGFQGINLIAGMLSTGLSGPVQALVERFGLSLNTIDMGWGTACAYAWSTEMVPVIFVVLLALNFVMILTKTTKTIWIDILNYWVPMLCAGLVYTQTGNFWMGVAAAVICAALGFICTDYMAKYTQDWLPGLSLPTGTAITMAPFVVLLDKLYDKIPGFNKLVITPEAISNKLGIFGDASFIGFLLGILIGVFAGCPATEVVMLGIYVAATIILFPKMTSMLLEGLAPITIAVQEMCNKSKLLKGRELYIGIDAVVIMSRQSSIVCGTLMIPILMILAMILPGNTTLPLADLTILGFFAGWPAVVHKDNLARMIPTCIITFSLLLLLCASAIAPVLTQMCVNYGYTGVAEGMNITSMNAGHSLTPWLLWKISTLFA